MHDNIEKMKTVYDQHLNLKIAANKLGMKWQTLYWNLKKVNHPVIGDKSKYGSNSDKLAYKAEQYFHELIPYAKNMNDEKFQAKYDFLVGDVKVEIKAARLTKSSHRCKSKRWIFSLKRQVHFCDFFVCIGFKESSPVKCLLIPFEIANGRQSVSIGTGASKWNDYLITFKDLQEFFAEVCNE